MRTLAEACSLRIIRCPSFGSHVYTSWAESWALIRVLRLARLRHVSVRLTWLLSPPIARDTNDRPAVIFQPSDSYTCGAIPLEHRHVSSQLGPGGQWLQQWEGPTAPRRTASGQYARAPRIRNIDRNVRSTVTVAYIWRKCRVEVESQVWGSLTLAQL